MLAISASSAAIFGVVPDVDADQNHAIGGSSDGKRAPRNPCPPSAGCDLRKGGLQDFIVGDACLLFRHIKDVVTGSPKTGHNARVAALIGKESHGFTRYPKAICSSAR